LTVRIRPAAPEIAIQINVLRRRNEALAVLWYSSGTDVRKRLHYPTRNVLKLSEQR
jgi:hypothetical protein